MAEFRVFLSAVTNEFGGARDALANTLQARDLTVKVQRSFRHDPTAESLLHKLKNYIETCHATSCLIGTRSGIGFPKPAEAAPFQAFLPAGIAEASYTQWEFFFAHKLLGPRCQVYFATSKFQPEIPDPPEGERPDLQAAFVRCVRDVVTQYSEVDSAGDFRADVQRDLPLEIEATQPSVVAAPKPVVLPYPSIGTLFKGRGPFLKTLRASLLKGGSAAIAGRAVHGLGGVGKTRAAVEYAWAHRADYNALALLDAETPDRLDSSLAALTGPLRLAEHAVAEQAVRVEAAVAWLNKNQGWFLILDNLDSQPALDAAHRLLGRLSGGHVVLTSRLAQFPRGIERLDLDVLLPDDAVSFLLEATATGRVRAPDDEAQARALAGDLGQLALALEMAAATIDTRRLSFSAYRTLWQGNRVRVIGWARQEITGYHHAVAETWQTSADQLTGAGRALLERLAFLAPEPVPTSLLREADEAALDDLAAYSLVTRDPQNETFVVHRLVQDTTRRGLDAAGRSKDRLTEALVWVNAAFAGNPQDVRTWKTLDPLAPHAEAVAGVADAAEIAEPTAELMGALDMLFDAKSLYPRAEQMSRAALAIVERTRGPDAPELATRLNNLATLLQVTNRLGEAEPLVRRVVSIFEASYGEAHPNVATALNNLAALLQATNRLGEAEPLMRRALAIDEASYGDAHPEVATDLNNLANLLQNTNRLGEAEPLMRRALAIDEASYGDAHPKVATRLNNLAQLLKATNRQREAEPLMRRALAIDEASYGDAHPEVARDLNNLAALLQATNRQREAEPLMRRALAIDEASYGDAHPNVAIRLNNLAQLLQDTNRLGEAEPLMRRALAIDEASYGDAHPEVARDLNNLAALLQATNRQREAEPLMRRALAIFCALEHAIGRTPPNGVAMQANYEDLLGAMGKSPAEVAVEVQAVRRAAGIT